MTLNDIEVKNDEIPQAFADFLKLKVETIKTEIRVEPGVYNGSKKSQKVPVNFLMIHSIFFYQLKYFFHNTIRSTKR